MDAFIREHGDVLNSEDSSKKKKNPKKNPKENPTNKATKPVETVKEESADENSCVQLESSMDAEFAECDDEISLE